MPAVDSVVKGVPDAESDESVVDDGKLLSGGASFAMVVCANGARPCNAEAIFNFHSESTICLVCVSFFSHFFFIFHFLCQRKVSREGFQQSKTENRRQEVPEQSSPEFPGVGHLGDFSVRAFFPTFISSRFVVFLLPCRSSPPLSGKYRAFAHDIFCCVLSVL
jgi:hypothetical protein